MSTGDFRSERGTVLLLSMVALSLLTFMVHRLTQEARSYARIARILEDGQRHQSDVRERLHTSATSSSTCREHDISTDGIHKTIAVCSREAPPFLTVPASSPPEGLFDYASIFGNVDACPGHRATITATSFSSPVATHTCTISSQQSSPLVILDNLDGMNLSLRGKGGTDTLLIATPGSIKVQGTLTVEQPLLIVAGGEILIESITSTASYTPRISIVSAHGDVTVRRTSGQLSLLLMGRGLLSAPPTPFLPPFPLPPTRSTSTIHGIIPTFHG